MEIGKIDTSGIDQVLAQLRAAASITGGRGPAPATVAGGDFGAMLRSAVDQVNGQQQLAKGLARDFELGSKDTGLHDVMVAMQKANVSFQAMVQVRNRLVSAYQEVMNMQV